MLATLKRAGLIWSTLLMLAALAVLLGLGNWQWQRKAWKEDLLARLQRSAEAPPVDLAALPTGAARDDIRFRRVRLRGTFDHAREFHLWSPTDKASAWRIITPLRLADPVGRQRYPLTYVLVIRGRVDDAHKVAATRPAGQVAGEVEVIGRVRFSSINWATPPPDTAKNQWYGLDLDNMRDTVLQAAVAGSASGSVAEATGLVAPFFVEAEMAAAPPPAPQPRLAALTLSNRHLEYALTWWGIALTLIGVYAAFAFGRLRGAGA